MSVEIEHVGVGAATSASWRSRAVMARVFSAFAGLFRPLPPIPPDNYAEDEEREIRSLAGIRFDIPALRSSCLRDPAFRVRVVGWAKDWEDRGVEHAAKANAWEEDHRSLFRWGFVVFLCMECVVVWTAFYGDPVFGFFATATTPVFASLCAGSLALFLRRGMARFAGLVAAVRQSGRYCRALAACYREAAGISQVVN